MSSLDYTTEDLAQRNGANLLASQLQTLQRDHNATLERHAKELARMREYLKGAALIGHNVLKARLDGRKTVRIEEVTKGVDL